MWCQKSRVQWLREGDQNTNFFHKMASVRRAINGIQSLQIGGVCVWVKDAEYLKAHVEEYFKSLFKDDRLLRPKVDGLPLPQLWEGQTE